MSSERSDKLRSIDQTGLKSGMAATIVLLVLAFVFDSWPLVVFVALSQLLGALAMPFAPYKLFYMYLVKPSGLAKSHVVPDNPEPHRFALLVGALFDGAAVIALLANAPVLAWLLVGIVVVLSNLNLWLDFCMGCWVYYQLNRLGVPGFDYSSLSE